MINNQPRHYLIVAESNRKYYEMHQNEKQNENEQFKDKDLIFENYKN